MFSKKVRNVQQNHVQQNRVQQKSKMFSNVQQKCSAKFSKNAQQKSLSRECSAKVP
jgi:hypothetical protein